MKLKQLVKDLKCVNGFGAREERVKKNPLTPSLSPYPTRVTTPTQIQTSNGIISIDLYEVMRKNGYFESDNDYSVDNQIKSYILYRILFLLDSIHDFKDVSAVMQKIKPSSSSKKSSEMIENEKNPPVFFNLCQILQDEMLEDINNVIKEIYDAFGNTQQSFLNCNKKLTEELCIAGKEELLREELFPENQNKNHIDYLFEELYSTKFGKLYSDRYVNSNWNDSEKINKIAEGVLLKLKIPLTNLANYVTRDTGIAMVIQANTTGQIIDTSTINKYFVNDAPAQTSKNSIINNTMSSEKIKRTNKYHVITSVADIYDKSGTSSKTTAGLNIFNITNELTIEEFYTFHLPNGKTVKHEFLKYTLDPEPITKNTSPTATLNIEHFGTSRGNWSNSSTNASKERVFNNIINNYEVLKRHDIKIPRETKQEIQAECMYKLFGDHSKHSVLWAITNGVFNSQQIPLGIGIGLTNDINGAASSSVKNPGSIMTSNSGLKLNLDGSYNMSWSEPDIVIERFSKRNFKGINSMRKEIQYTSGDTYKSYVDTGNDPMVIASGSGTIPGQDYEVELKIIKAQDLLRYFKKNPYDEKNLETALLAIQAFDKMEFGKKRSKRFIQEVNRRSALKGTAGSFKSWCDSQSLTDSRGKVTMRCIAKAKKSGNTKLIKKAVFAQNIKGYSGTTPRKTNGKRVYKSVT